MSFIGTKFKYNNQDSDSYGVSLVSVNTGMLQRNFGVQKTINKEKIRYKDTPLLYGVERNTYTLEITIAKIDYGNTVWTLEDRLAISQWLMPSDNQFHDFESEDYGDIVFPLQFISGEFSDNYSNEGYVVFQCEMQSPYPFTRPMYTEPYEITNEGTIIEIENRSNVLEYYYPVFEYKLGSSTTDIKIVNLSVGGEETKFENLTPSETLVVDNENKIIRSSTGNERISGFNFCFLRLSWGINRLQVFGEGEISFKLCFPVMI